MLLFMDGFDFYNNSVQRGWAFSFGSFSYGNTSPAPRFGTGQRVSTSNTDAFRQLATNYATLYAGRAVYFSTLGPESLLAFADAGTKQIDVQVTTNGEVRVTRNGTQLAISAQGLVTQGTWFHIGLKATIHNTSGSFTAYLNGVAVLTATGVNTRATANNYANQVRIGSGASSFIDDFYVGDTSGSVNNDFLGDVKVETIYPTGAGNSTQFTPNTGTNWGANDEVPPNSDTDYVQSSTLNDVDLYACGNLATATGNVLAVQPNLFVRKDDAGTRSIAPVIRNDATDSVGTSVPLTTSYTYVTQLYETNPSKGNIPWTIADVNDSEFGVKVTV